ncbi:uncharacterized protein TNCV_1976271, partial [Trichonephila clavipes]
CQVIHSQFGLAIHQNDHQARRRFVEWAQNEIAVVPDFHKRILFSDEAHFWLNGYINKQNCRIWSEANPQVYVETPLQPEKLTVWCALWAGGILLQNDEGHNVTVNGDRYRAMITNFFIPELNNHDVQKLWFQQDGATCHTARATIDLLKDTFGDRLISRFGPVNWPPRSCDLTPLVYFRFRNSEDGSEPDLPRPGPGAERSPTSSSVFWIPAKIKCPECNWSSVVSTLVRCQTRWCSVLVQNCEGQKERRICCSVTKHDHAPLGALGLQNQTISRVPEAGAPHAFKVSKFGESPYYFSADDEDTATRWISALNQVAATASRVDPYVDESLRNAQLPSISIPNVDCEGPLSKFSQRWKTWRRRYFLLKDASLYFYTDRNAKVALGLFQLHGYKVQSSSLQGQKNAFEAIPPEPRLKHLYFLADTENEKKRWLSALDYSIDRWIKIG